MNEQRTYRFVVMGNAVVDAIIHADDALLSQFGLRKGDSNAISHAQMMKLSEVTTVEQFRSGGVAANTAYTLSRLGSKVAFVSLLGNDPTGRFFAEDMVNAGVTMTLPRDGVRTTDIFTLITPDGARTMVQSEPPPPSSDDSWVEDSMIEQSEYLVVEAYLICSQPAAVEYAAKLAARNGVRLVISLGSQRAVQAGLSLILDLVTVYNPIVIGNITEWDLLVNGTDAHTAAKLAQTERVLTRSGEGAAYYAQGGETVVDSPTQPIPKPTDLTGAGDAFAGGFLHIFTGGGSPQLALQQGHQLARAVVLQLGPRLLATDDLHPVSIPHHND